MDLSPAPGTFIAWMLLIVNGDSDASLPSNGPGVRRDVEALHQQLESLMLAQWLRECPSHQVSRERLRTQN